MKERALIIIGGNSKLISELLILKLNEKYKRTIIVTHRKYKGENCYEIIEFTEPKLIIKTLEEIMSNRHYQYDIIVSNTPPQNANFQNEKTQEWGEVPIKIMNMVSVNHFNGKILFTGSCLSLLPFYHESFYKRLKEREMRTFVNLDLNIKKKLTYLILPPLKKINKEKLNFIWDDYRKWALILREELGLDNLIVYPRGLVGLVTKILFFIKYKVL